MKEIGIGIVGGGYMGKAHAVAMSAVGAVFNTNLMQKKYGNHLIMYSLKRSEINQAYY